MNWEDKDNIVLACKMESLGTKLLHEQLGSTVPERTYYGTAYQPQQEYYDFAYCILNSAFPGIEWVIYENSNDVVICFPRGEITSEQMFYYALKYL